jgi:hypothetical protein
MASIQLKYIIE